MDTPYKVGDLGLLVEEDGHGLLVDVKEVYGGVCRAHLIDMIKDESSGVYKVDLDRFNRIFLSEVERKLFDVFYSDMKRLRPDNVDFESIGHWQNAESWLKNSKK